MEVSLSAGLQEEFEDNVLADGKKWKQQGEQGRETQSVP